MKHPSVSEALTGTIPHAEPDFQRRLEEELIAKMQPTTPENLNGHHDSYPTQRPIRPLLHLPFTLAAAMLLVILVSSVLFFRGKDSPSNMGLMVAGNSTPTVSNTEVAVESSTPSPQGDSLLTTATAIVAQGTQRPQVTNDSGQGEICRAVVFNNSGVRLRAAPTLRGSIIGEIESGTEVSITAWTQSENSSWDWLFGRGVKADGTSIEGWLRSDVIAQITNCPLNTVSPENVVAPNGKILFPVVIALQDIPRGTKIIEDMLTVVYWPVESVPENIFAEPNLLIGTVPRVDIERYRPILQQLIASSDATIPGIPSDRIAVTVPLSTYKRCLCGSNRRCG